MTTDQAALAERRRLGCLLGTDSDCICPSSPPYEHCRKRAQSDAKSTSARMRETVLEMEDLRATLAVRTGALTAARRHVNEAAEAEERALEKAERFKTEADRLRDFVASIADLHPGAGLSDSNLRNLIERAKEVLS